MPSKRRPKKPQETRFTIAVEGDGIGLKDVGLRQLSDLLGATAAFVEAVATEKGLEPPKLSLARAKQGSAAYELISEAETASRVVSAAVSAVRKRGQGSSPRTRTSMVKLYNTASKSGSLRFDPPSVRAGVEAKPVRMAPPLDDDATQIEEGTVVFGRVVGLRIDGAKGTVSIRYDDGGTGNFDADLELVAKAARTIIRNADVRARVTFLRGEYRDFDGAIEDITEHAAKSDFLEAIAEVRKNLDEAGVEIDADAWFAQEREP